MPQYRVYLFSLLILTALITACTKATRPLTGGEPEPATTAPPRYDHGRFQPWNENITANTAVRSLLQQADGLIEQRQFRRAEDKLERVLGIAPDAATAWSRMAWLALQMDKPVRTRQMASRSNSFAADNVTLKLLNWNFIREASVRMNDSAGVERADAVIEKMRRQQ